MFSTLYTRVKVSDCRCHFSLSPDPKICTLTPNGHLEMGSLSAALGVFAAERRSFALGSRKSSIISLGKASLEQRSLSLVREDKSSRESRLTAPSLGM